jgi:hypothetical protein
MGYRCTTLLYQVLVSKRVAKFRDIQFDKTYAKDLMSRLELKEEELINLPYP